MTEKTGAKSSQNYTKEVNGAIIKVKRGRKASKSYSRESNRYINAGFVSTFEILWYFSTFIGCSKSKLPLNHTKLK